MAEGTALTMEVEDAGKTEKRKKPYLICKLFVTIKAKKQSTQIHFCSFFCSHYVLEPEFFKQINGFKNTNLYIVQCNDSSVYSYPLMIGRRVDESVDKIPDKINYISTICFYKKSYKFNIPEITKNVL